MIKTEKKRILDCGFSKYGSLELKHLYKSKQRKSYLITNELWTLLEEMGKWQITDKNGKNHSRIIKKTKLDGLSGLKDPNLNDL